MGNASKSTPNRTESPTPPSETASPNEAIIRRRIAQTQRQVQGVDLTVGFLTLVVAALVYLLAAAVIDHWLVRGGLGFVGRWLLCLGFWAGVGVLFVRRLLPSLRWRIHPLFAASTLEQSRPSLKNSLINFLLLRSHRREVAAPIYQAVEWRAAADLNGIQPDAAVDRSRVIRLGMVLAGVLAVFAIYLVVSPKNPLRSAARVLWPWSDVGAPTRVTIRAVQPGHVTAFYGDRIQVSAEIAGLGRGESPQLFYSTADGQTMEQSVPMTRPEGEYRYQCDLPPDPSGLQQSCRYWIAVGDARSRSYQVAVQAAPAIEVARVTYHYPAHLGLADRTVLREGDLRAVEGTEVTIHAKANVAIRQGTAEIDLGCTGRHGLRMKVAGDEATGRFTLRLKAPEPDETLRTPTAEYNTYQLRFADSQGHENPRPIRYHIEVLPDRSAAPTVAPDQKNAEATDRPQQSSKEQQGDQASRDAQDTAPGSGTSKTSSDRADRGQPNTDQPRQPSPSYDAAGTTGTSSSAAQRSSETAPSSADQRSEPRIDPDSNPADAIQEILNDRKEQQKSSPSGSSGDAGQTPSNKQQQQSSGSPSSSASQSAGDRSSGSEQPSGGQQSSGNAEKQAGGEKSGASQKQSAEQTSGGAEKPSGGNAKQPSGSNTEKQSGGSAEKQPGGDVAKQSGGEKSGASQEQHAGQPSDGQSGEKSGSAATESQPQAQGHDANRSKGEERQESNSAGGSASKSPAGGAGQKDTQSAEDASAESRKGSDQTGAGQKSGDARSDGQKSAAAKTEGGRGDGAQARDEHRDGKSSSEKPQKTKDGQPGKTKSEQPTDEAPDAQMPEGQRTGSQPGKSQALEPSRAKSADRQQAGTPQSGDHPQPTKDQGGKPSQPADGASGGASDAGKGADQPKPSKSGAHAGSMSDKNEGASDAAADTESKQPAAGASSGSTSGGQKLGDELTESNPSAGTSDHSDAGQRPGSNEKKTPPSDAHSRGASSEESSGSSSGDKADADAANPQTQERRSADKSVADQSKLGGRPGQPSGESPTYESTKEAADQANLEYARRQTELALQHLHDQLTQEKPKLLERLGWSKDDAERFLQRWRQMQASAAQPGPDGRAARQRLDAELRSLGLRPKAVELRHGTVPIDRTQGNRDASRYAPPPADWAEQYRAYTRGVAGERETDRPSNQAGSRGP